jgi:hypothetical protein
MSNRVADINFNQLWLRDVSELDFLLAYPKELSNAQITERIEKLRVLWTMVGKKTQKWSHSLGHRFSGRAFVSGVMEWSVVKRNLMQR